MLPYRITVRRQIKGFPMTPYRNPVHTAAKVAVIYALVSVAWILFSDQLVAAATTDPETMTLIQMIKGWAFVLTTSLLIFFMMRQEMSRFLKAEDAQRASEENFRLLVENAPDPIFIQTRCQFAYLNAAATALFGAAHSAELIGMSVMERYHTDFHDIIRERIHQVNTERKPAPAIEQVFVRMDGSHVQVEVNSVPFEYKSENGALVFVRDITERKVAEEASRRYELLVENSRDIIYFIQRDNGRILAANGAAVAAYGYSRDELLTLRVQDLREPGTVALLPEQMARADAAGILFETTHRRKDATTFPIEISSKGATINGVRTLISIGRDITERKRTEDALRDSETRFKTLADSMPQLVWTAGPDGQMDYFNQRIDEFDGFVKQPDGNWEWSAAVHPEDLQSTVDAWQHTLRSGGAHETEHRLVQRDGSYKWFLSRTTPVRDPEGRVVKWYGTSTEIDSRKQTEAALAESEARLRLALESARMGIWELDIETNRMVWDEAHHALFGINPGQFDGTAASFYRFVQPEDRATLQEATRKAIECRSAYGMEFRIVHPNGEQRWMRSQGQVLCDDGTKPSRIMGGVWDITQRKHDEEKLMDATRRLDLLVTESPAVVFTYELHPEPRPKFISRNVEKILGWRPEHFIDNPASWWECLHPADLPVVRDGLARLEKTGRQVFEYRFKDAQGRYHWIHDEERLIVSANGRQEVVGAWWDVTEARAAQEELRRLAAAIEQAAEMVVITNARAEILYANPAFEKITGYRQDEVLGKNPRILKSGEHDHVFYQKMWASLSAGKPWQGRLVNRKRDGSVYTEESTISPVLDPSGEIVNYVAVKRDVTREEELEQQYLEAQKMEAIGTLAGGIAHDFNNILAIILANAQILEFSGALGTESKETLVQIITASKRARQLVGQILAFSRRGRQEKIIMNLKPIVKETLGLLRASLPSTIRLDPDIAANTGMLCADPTQMQQVLMNLCTNAAHAMEKDGGVLKIELSNRSIGDNEVPMEPGFAPGDYVRLSVADTGQGMPPWVLKRIFEPYFTTKETGKGTGLGLSVAHGIVKAHGGTIKVSSALRQGTVFDVYLPMIKAEEAETDKSDMPLIGGTGRVLFVDDEPALTLMGQKILSQLGYQVQTTNSPAEALEAFRSQPKEFDLVITDLTMPEMTGTQLAKKLLAIRPDLPIVLCTGFSDQVNGEMLKSIGIRSLLLKPLTIQELAHSVRLAIEAKQ
jgi:PAS domain S-box-containing protein